MLARQVRTGLIVAALASCAGLGAWFIGARPAYPADAKPAKLDALLKERLATAKELYRLVVEKLNVGTAIVAQVNEVRIALLRAELETCTTDEERVAALARSLAEARHIEDTVLKQIAQGLLAPVEAPCAKLSRLETEIELEWVKAKQAFRPGA